MDQGFKILKTNREDKEFILELTEKMRDQDLKEMAASGIYDYLEEVAKTVEYSEQCCKVITDDGQLICGFGIIPAKLGAQIWFLGTDLIKNYRKSFVKISAKILLGWVKKYGRLFNFVSTENIDGIIWLEHMGAKFEKKLDYNGHVFLQFVIERS